MAGKKYINLVGSSSATAKPKRKRMLKAKSRRSGRTSKVKSRGTGRGTR
jgi:hypothetical protein